MAVMSRFHSIGAGVFLKSGRCMANADTTSDAINIARALNALEGVPEWLDKKADQIAADCYFYKAAVLHTAAADIRAGKWETNDG
jgi:hypothetical protein